MLSNIKGVGFDLDGTLMNTLPGISDAVGAMLKSIGLPAPDKELVSTWIGNGSTVLVERALRWAGVNPSPVELIRFRSAYDCYYVDAVEQGSQLYPGVIETIEQLKQQNIKMAVVTNKPSRFVPSLLEQLRIAQYFDTTIGADDVIIKKPHPAPMYLILGRLGLRANELVFMGDSRNDIEAAKAAGCMTVGVNYGYNYGESIALSNPDYVIEKFSDILSVIELADANGNLQANQKNNGIKIGY